MKKVIILLALVLGIKVNAQIVGGFLPLNSSKTPTMAGIRVTGTTNKIGNTTLITSNTTTLTSGATSGTVANLSHAVFSVNCFAQGGSFADASTYYLGNLSFNSIGAPQGWAKVYIPYNCTLVGWTANFYTAGGVGSAESSTIALGVDNSYTTLSSAISMSAATSVNTYSATGLSTNVNAGSYIEARLVTPTWVTNPLTVVTGITLWFVRRQ